MNKKFKIKKGDSVIVLAGKDKGKSGSVTSVLKEKERVIKEGRIEKRLREREEREKRRKKERKKERKKKKRKKKKKEKKKEKKKKE